MVHVAGCKTFYCFATVEKHQIPFEKHQTLQNHIMAGVGEELGISFTATQLVKHHYLGVALLLHIEVAPVIHPQLLVILSQIIKLTVQ